MMPKRLKPSKSFLLSASESWRPSARHSCHPGRLTTKQIAPFLSFVMSFITSSPDISFPLVTSTTFASPEDIFLIDSGANLEAKIEDKGKLEIEP